MIVARVLRLLLVGCYVAVVFLAVLAVAGLVLGAERLDLLAPFAAALVAAGGLGLVLPHIDRLVGQLTQHRQTTPYSALAAAAARIRAGTLAEALPGLAEVLAEGTGAQRAVLWLAVSDRLVSAAVFPPEPDGNTATPHTVDNLGVLLARPDTDHVVPVLDGPVLRAALAIGKPDVPLTPADQQLMQDVANGAGLLLRGVALNTELEQRVRRAAELAAQLQESRQRLTHAREVERRRLVTELSHVTTDRLAALHRDLAAARAALNGPPGDPEQPQRGLAKARAGLDELLERFRVIARGVYPAVLRDQGPVGALDELVADLPRPVQLSGGPIERLDWEVESGIYYLTASAMQHLAGVPAEEALRVHLEHAEGRLTVRITDPALPTPAGEVRAALADDVERLAALGGDVELTEDGKGGALLRATLPDQLHPAVEQLGLRALAPGPR
ncbi:hypothetical protein PA7_43670 [Pseudonocardia asaccharolytica DSM 44247 = NBRC 16224]|uniref:Histidine kinase n=2 Tax=Pseudonocardia asaccharolytica TaxID=54010 RepID=A0A511D6V8_9PSEU|nr:hypothetical protein PA7_43670 [Pseudonocardia asaccharolytica DSM 44247 = NBRC 16224]